MADKPSAEILSILNGVGLRERDRTVALFDGGVKDQLRDTREVSLLGGGLLD